MSQTVNELSSSADVSNRIRDMLTDKEKRLDLLREDKRILVFILYIVMIHSKPLYNCIPHNCKLHNICITIFI